MRWHPALLTLISSTRKWLLLILLAALCFAFFYFDLDDYLTFENIKTHHKLIVAWTNSHYLAAVSLYILIFTVMIACTIPGATLLTLIGGFLFGAAAIVYAIAGITLGGTVLLYAVRFAVGNYVALKASGWIKRVERGFQKNAFHYILMLRLMPVFPCWISNIAAGALNVPYRTFFAATVLGVTPATIIYVLLGRGLDTLLMANQTPNLAMVMKPTILLPLLGLAFLSLIPVFYKRKRENLLDTPESADRMKPKRPGL